MTPPVFDKILIANRGEIAVRIIRGCRELGIRTVAVFSEIDRAGLHVMEADEAVCIGGAPAAESYLNMEKIIEAAHRTGVQAIHPGYGFLSENHAFAALCEEEKIVFIGPDSRAMKLVGDKIQSRRTMKKAGIPIIPGMQSICGGFADIEKEARSLGYPVMIKASAGGGGKGMRVAENPEELKSGIEAGRREAKGAFGDESVYLEKFIREPRHVEFQVLADKEGRVVHLFERECSIQRRHQKIIEESPSPAMNPGLRLRMGEAAVKVIQVSGYSNAGTVEFLLDEQDNFYFLEVNARLQVEHPVTEMVTGVDLVHHQISIAAGRPLGLGQSDLQQRGHAIECRIYAEDPENQFLPSAGKILYLKEPGGAGIRNDSGIYQGCEVPVFYDPILAKLIVWGETREAACRKMSCALKDYIILGVKTPIAFLKDVVAHPSFIKGETTTGFIPRHFKQWTAEKATPEIERIAALAAVFDGFGTPAEDYSSGSSRSEVPSPWRSLGDWKLTGGKSRGI